MVLFVDDILLVTFERTWLSPFLQCLLDRYTFN